MKQKAIFWWRIQSSLAIFVQNNNEAKSFSGGEFSHLKQFLSKTTMKQKAIFWWRIQSSLAIFVQNNSEAKSSILV